MKKSIRYPLKVFFDMAAFFVYAVSLAAATTTNPYTALQFFCYAFRNAVRIERHLAGGNNTPDLSDKFSFYFHKLLARYSRNGNRFYEAYNETREAKRTRIFFRQLDIEYRVRLKFPRNDDNPERQGDLMILKPFRENPLEKGIIIIHFTEALGRVAALFDLEKISKRYRLIAEPSWSGYQHPYFFLYLGLSTDFIVESPFSADHAFIGKAAENFFPVETGAGDWVDTELFNSEKKGMRIFDIVMVGNWSKIKRHEVMFRAVSKLRNRNSIRIALVGYASHGRTKETIRDEAKKYNLQDAITFFEKIPAHEVAEVLRKSKINVLLSKKEGANRGIYEGLFCGNVIVCYSHNEGVNRSVINEKTGFWADDSELPAILEKALREFDSFDTADWAGQNTGFAFSSHKMNEFMKKLALRAGEAWSHDMAWKINRPNNLYANHEDRIALDQEYKKIAHFLKI